MIIANAAWKNQTISKILKKNRHKSMRMHTD